MSPEGVTSCGDCFESYTSEGPVPVFEEVEIHAATEGHRYDAKYEEVE